MEELVLVADKALAERHLRKELTRLKREVGEDGSFDNIAHGTAFAIGLPVPTRVDHQPFTQPTSPAPCIRILRRIVKPIKSGFRLSDHLRCLVMAPNLMQLFAQ